MIKLGSDDGRMARQIYNVRPDDSVPAVGLRNKLELDSMRKC